MSRYVGPVERYFSTATPPAPLVGGKLYFYVTGTSTLAVTYSDAELETENENPVELDAQGYPETPIFLDPDVTYRVRLESSTGVEQWDEDPVTGFVSQADFNALEEELTDRIDALEEEVRDIVSNIYDIGDVIMTTNTADPADKFGGTWERYAEGRTIFGYKSSDPDFDTVGDTLGAKTATLITANLPAHDHPAGIGLPNTGPSIYSDTATGVPGNATSRVDLDAGAPTLQPVTGQTGSGTAFSIMPPGIVTYFWRRTA